MKDEEPEKTCWSCETKIKTEDFICIKKPVDGCFVIPTRPGVFICQQCWEKAEEFLRKEAVDRKTREMLVYLYDRARR